MIDIRETILAQYANSPALLGIIARFNAAIDPRALIESFLQNVWNPETATGWGLDVWGRIVGVGRVQKVEQEIYWGFAEAEMDGDPLPFGEGVFFNGSPIMENYVLSDDEFRRLIFAKAAANISNGSIAAVNDILMRLFGGGKKRIYLTEGEAADDYFGFAEANNGKGPQPFQQGIFYADTSLAGAAGRMTICYNWHLSPLDKAIIEHSGILPRPAGVHVILKRIYETWQNDFAGDIL